MSNEIVKLNKTELLFDKWELLTLILPLVLEMFLTFLVGMIDAVMVSSVGEYAVSGVSMVDTVMQLLIYIFAALGTGGAVVAGQYLGSGNPKKARESSEQLVWFSFLLSFLVMITLFVVKGLILNNFFGQIAPQVRESADTYLTITALSIPAIALYEAGAAIFRTMSNSKVTMNISVLMNVINITGDSVLIFGFGMEVAGAAIATLLSRIAAAIVIVYLLLDERRELHIRKSLRIRFIGQQIYKILYIGVPNGIENGVFQLGKILVMNLITSFGTSAIAANAVAVSITNIQALPGAAIALGITTIISRCIGKGDYEQAKYYNRLLIIVTYVAFITINGLIYLALPLALPMYHLSGKTAHLASQMVLCHTLGTFCVWPIAFDLPASMRAAGDVKFAMVISVMSMWIFRIGTAYLLARYLRMGAVGVWIAMVVDWFFRAAIFGVRWKSGKWREKKVV